LPSLVAVIRSAAAISLSLAQLSARNVKALTSVDRNSTSFDRATIVQLTEKSDQGENQ